MEAIIQSVMITLANMQFTVTDGGPAVPNMSERVFWFRGDPGSEKEDSNQH